MFGSPVLLGIVVLFGWATLNHALMSVLPGYVTMKVNTATGFLVSGASLYLAVSHLRYSKSLSRLLSVCVFALGAFTLGEYILKVDLHIDQLLFHDAQQVLNPGRPAFVTSVAFCLAGVSLFLLAGTRISRRISQVTSLVLLGLAFSSIVGYIYGVPVLYGSFGNVNSMALHTGVGFLILGTGAILGHTDSAVGKLLLASETGSSWIRRLLPLLIVLPVLLGYLYLRPAMNFGELRFAMALFAVTLVVGGTLALLALGISLNRRDRQRREIAQIAMEATTAIEMSERELRMVTDYLPTLISYIDTTGRLLRVNRTHEVWLGRPASEIVGSTVRELLGEDYWERTQGARETAANGVTSSVETTLPTVRGNRCAVITFSPDLGEMGALRGFACMTIDVDDQRKAEAALRESEKLAAVGRLSSSIAHEINNPIDAVMNILYLAREDSESVEVKAMLETADGELRRVASIVGQTLRFHQRADTPDRVLAADLFSSVLVLHSFRLRNLRIHVERRDRADEPFECFEGEIRQVLNNLVANASDAMEPGGRLYLRSRPAREWSTGRLGVTLTVADTGCGMSEKIRDRVFQAFFSTKGVGGTGLGLWITDEIVGKHGGRIRIRSSTKEASHGSVFVLFLPLTIGVAQADRSAAPKEEAVAI